MSASDATVRVVEARAALVAFVVAEIVGAVVYVVNARKMWFFGVFGDEWDFLAGRRLTLHDLLLRHGDHLVALPALAFRLLYSVVGLRSYLPYQLLAIALHLAAAALLRVVMRRAGVNPWIATAATALFVLFGSGSQDILIAFQITFSGALVLGLGQLLLADHDGPLDRRDVMGLLAGLGSLLCSDVAIPMIATVGIAALLLGRWKAAALHTLPLALVYLSWSSRYGRTAHVSFGLDRFTTSARTSISATFDALGRVPFVGWLFAVMLVAGIVVAWRTTDRGARAGRLATSIALTIGALLFVSMLALTRAELGSQFAASSRYEHILAALFLPALAVAADALAGRRRALLVGAVALFLVGIPGNIGEIGRNVGPAARYRSQRRIITSLPRIDLARDVPRSLRPAPSFAAEVTVGWLLDGARSGRIPAADRPNPVELATDRLRLSLEQVDQVPQTACAPLRTPLERRLRPGDSIGVRGTIAVQSRPEAGLGAPSQGLPFGTSLLSTIPAHTLRVVAGPLTLRIAPLSPSAKLC
jgi:hypothetical protein